MAANTLPIPLWMGDFRKSLFWNLKLRVLVSKQCSIITLGIVQAHHQEREQNQWHLRTLFSIWIRYVPKSWQTDVPPVFWRGLNEMENNVQQYPNFFPYLTWCACTIPKVIKTNLFVTKTHNLGTQNYTFLISPSQHKRNGFETQIVAMNGREDRIFLLWTPSKKIVVFYPCLFFTPPIFATKQTYRLSITLQIGPP